MKLLYATSLRFPSSLANRIQIVSMANAFDHTLGNSFTLGMSVGKEHTNLSCNVVEMGTKTKSPYLAWNYLRYASANNFTHIYCREEKLLFFLVLFSRVFFKSAHITFCYEVHRLEYAPKLWHKYILSHMPYVIPITEGMRASLQSDYGYKGTMFVAADAVDPALFEIPQTKEEARVALGLPLDKKIALYAGSLEPWKGADTFYESIRHMGSEWLFVIVGGKPPHVTEFLGTHELHESVRMEGQKPYNTALPQYLRAADIAVIPNSGVQEISRVSTSPLKLFAYMASGTPIVASDLPSLREILTDDLAVLVKPDDAEALAQGIQKAQSDPQRAERADRAKKLVRERYTWNQRSDAIVSFIQGRL
ncbi:MAG: N-acetyllactosaminide 3-alpha-galactosyltransferase [Parcubacteria bacterium C7867-008]|nr:MAG: N-acetyllactosaminide 3-alpha-galactosyltransferase [Parcubacteria bacterium C7867-008]